MLKYVVRFQNRDMAYCYVLLLFSILYKHDALLAEFVQKEDHIEFCHALNVISQKKQLKTTDIMKIINGIFNLASNNDFLKVFEMKYTGDIFNVEQVIASISNNELEVIRYIRIEREDYIYLIIKILFEWNLDSEIKLYYLKILQKALQYSYYNAFGCGQVRQSVLLF